MTPLSFLLAASLSSALAAPAPFRVTIDAGHGGVDTGAVSGRVKEADVALQVALALERRLAADPRFRVHLTRDSDRALSLQERVRLADEARSELFLSIHANASPDPRARGVEFYFQNQLPADEEALYLAAIENKLVKESETSPSDDDGTGGGDVKAILEDLKRQHRLRTSLEVSRILAAEWRSVDRIVPSTIRQAPFHVVSQENRPAVLIELGFVTHPVEGPRLARKDHQERVADKIYQSLVRFVRGDSLASAP